MNKEPSARYASTTEMRAALDELGPLSTRGPSRVPSRPPATRVGDVAMAATITPDVLSAVSDPPTASRSAPTPVANVAADTRPSRWPWLLGIGGLIVGLGVAALALTRPQPLPIAAPPVDPAAVEAATEARARAIAEEVMRETAAQLATQRDSEPSTTLTPVDDATERDCRAVVEDPTPLRVRAEPSVRAEVRGELPTGARVEIVDRRSDAWGRVRTPVDGWIWLENVREPCANDVSMDEVSKAPPPARARAATSRLVRCGDTEREVPIVRRGDEVVVSLRRTNNVVPIDHYRDVSYSWTPALTRCYMGKPSVGGIFTIHVDPAGRITTLERNPLCDAPSGLEACLRGFLVGSEVGNTTGAPGELQFDISHRRPR
jgi:hypothetical protein